jgi:hypothetical protein
MSSIDIRKDIEATLCPDAIGHSTFTKYLREIQVTHDNELTPTSIEDECQGLIDKATLLELAEEPFASVCRIASKTLISRMKVYRRLVGPLGMTVKHLHWVPHRLSLQQNGSRVQKAQEHLAVFKLAKHNSLKKTITPDESFFYLHTDFE